MKAKSIKELVEFALADRANKHAEYTFSKLPKGQAEIIQMQIGVNLSGCERMMDTSGIRHTLRKHGNAITEAKRGQIAVNTNDFELIPQILKQPDNIYYDGKNKLKQDVFLYEKRIGNLYVVVEAVRFAKNGNKPIVS